MRKLAETALKPAMKYAMQYALGDLVSRGQGISIDRDVVHPCRCDRLQLITAVEPGELSCLRRFCPSMRGILLR